MNDFVFIAAITLKSSIAVLLASIGEIVAERSGVLNLGVEGMMLAGALAAFAAGFYTGSPLLAFSAAMGAGALLALLHAVMVIRLQANQVISGLAITILGTGLSSFLGRPLIGRIGLRIEPLSAAALEGVPVLGPVFSQQSLPALLALLLVPAAAWILGRTALGLNVRAVGQDPAAADAAGVPVFGLRYACTLCGGILAGLGGAYLSLVYTPGWKENMTGGQGWIAIAMVIFATWRPWRALGGALLFGGLNALQFYFQATGSQLVPAYVLRLLPYLLTVLILFSATVLRKGAGGAAPAALGQPFHRED